MDGDLDVKLTGVLLGLATALLLSVASQAAELPTMKAAPAAPMKKCNLGGMAGVVVPGSGVCVKIGGYISGAVEAGSVKQ
jgi:hypothetical protein